MNHKTLIVSLITLTLAASHALIAGLRPASLILARRIAFPLLLLGAGLVLIQPCAGQSGTWTPTGSLGTARHSYGNVAAQRPGARRRRTG